MVDSCENQAPENLQDYHPSRVLTFVYLPFAIGTIVIFAYHEAKINTRKRNLIGYILFTISIFLLIILDLTTKGHGGIGPYIVLCTIVALFGFADASVRGGMIGDLSLMCPELIQSFVAGLAMAGALTSAFRLITKAAFEKSHDGLRKGANDVSKNQRLNNKELLLETVDYVVNLFLIYVLTLSILPGFLYENTGQHGLGSWYALVLIAMYNWWDLVGRYTPMVKWLKVENRKGLTVAVLTRFLLVPAFYFTAKYGDQGWMILLVSVLGLTNGHLTVCILATAPRGYTGPEKNALGYLLVLFIILYNMGSICRMCFGLVMAYW
ncbi:Equilibrative nucleoside transporter [Arabidopsis thaliana x Arabidopsis arenosa]|uniref:Equilibrative nucleoside transporter n=1 Tax=Arabidopsis thaliana x Arabidopsis arenosa TaxID=1240361 RepID=A0A8T1Z3S1_9BRAS|nr:Equilibrative nucleoside transporter [Arabidopsis thaliana x Arabidopsis arenosa]